MGLRRFDDFLCRLLKSKKSLKNVIRYVCRADVSHNASKKHNLRIFSLAIPGGRVYVVNHPTLVMAVQRLPKALSFWPVVANSIVQLGGLSIEGENRLLNDAQGLRGKENLFLESMKLVHKSMRLGEGLDQMTRVMAVRVAGALDQLEHTQPHRIDLWDWVRHVITLAATASVYGPDNPFQSPLVEKSFW